MKIFRIAYLLLICMCFLMAPLPVWIASLFGGDRGVLEAFTMFFAPIVVLVLVFTGFLFDITVARIWGKKMFKKMDIMFPFFLASLVLIAIFLSRFRLLKVIGYIIFPVSSFNGIAISVYCLIQLFKNFRTRLGLSDDRE